MCGCLLCAPFWGPGPQHQVCALTRNQTSGPLACRPVLNPLSHTSQGLLVSLKGLKKSCHHFEILRTLLQPFTEQWHTNPYTGVMGSSPITTINFYSPLFLIKPQIHSFSKKNNQELTSKLLPSDIARLSLSPGYQKCSERVFLNSISIRISVSFEPEQALTAPQWGSTEVEFPRTRARGSASKIFPECSSLSAVVFALPASVYRTQQSKPQRVETVVRSAHCVISNA